MKKTVVLGASPNPSRFSYKAVKSLVIHGFDVVPVGFRPGVAHDRIIQRGQPEIEDVHTVAMYVGPQRQLEFYDYILSLGPRRVIFNPGTNNPELMNMLNQMGVEVVEGCTLVMIDNDEF